MDFLDKVEKGISELENSEKTIIDLELTYGELRTIRKFLLLENYATDLSADNLRQGMKLRNRIK